MKTPGTLCTQVFSSNRQSQWTTGWVGRDLKRRGLGAAAGAWLGAGLGVCVACCSLRAAEPSGAAPASSNAAAPAPTAVSAASTAPEPAEVKSTWDQIVESEVGKAFTQGKFSLNARLRWEHADQEGRRASDAVTIRPRFGFTTASAYGFQGMLEGENVTSLGAPYNPAGLDPDESDRTVIADPETTEVNQAWLSYSRWDSMARGGRQRIVLDNHRFIGDVGWRQNMQTYDGVIAQTAIIPNGSFFYGYISRVNRVLGDDHPSGNYNSDSHLFNASYETCPFAKFTAYGYLLDFDNAADFSSTSAGLSLTGLWEMTEKARLDYRAEFAWQTGAANNPVDYDALYYTIQAEVTRDPFMGGVGFEVLGSDDGLGSFQTPLATLHKFNGWADVFLTTPREGLRDFWVQAGVHLPLNLPFRVIYHKFWSQDDGQDFGQEIDMILSRKFGKYFSALAKYAYYDGAASYPNIHRFWLELTFNY